MGRMSCPFLCRRVGEQLAKLRDCEQIEAEVAGGGEESADRPGGASARRALLQAPRGKDLAGDAVWRHVRSKMTDTHETKLVEALRKVDVHGDVAPAHVQDPMTMVLRQTAFRPI